MQQMSSCILPIVGFNKRKSIQLESSHETISTEPLKIINVNNIKNNTWLRGTYKKGLKYIE